MKNTSTTIFFKNKKSLKIDLAQGAKEDQIEYRKTTSQAPSENK